MSLAANLLLAAMAGAPVTEPDLVPLGCDSCARWNEPAEPVRIAPNTWYVGPKGLAVLVHETPAGLVLFDGALPESVPQVLANLAALGHKPGDIKLILNSHAHYDHAGGLAALSRLSGAPVATRRIGAAALARGNVDADDPLAGYGAADNAYPPVARTIALADGETIDFGGTRFTAHDSSGHTPGSTSFSWQDCGDDGCVDVVFGDSVTPVSGPGFRYTEDPARVADFRESLDRLAALPCQVLIATHPELGGFWDRAAAPGGPERFIEPSGCREYAALGHRRLDAVLEDEAR